MAAGDLRAAPLSIDVGGQQLVLSPYLWRDFQPVAPADGQPLIAVLRVQASGNAPVSNTIRVDAVWVVFGDEVWATAISEERAPSSTQPFYEAVVRNGPKWGPGVNVEVVVRVRDRQGSARLLRAANQPINRTD
jgi:hypothetical protein